MHKAILFYLLLVLLFTIVGFYIVIPNLNRTKTQRVTPTTSPAPTPILQSNSPTPTIEVTGTTYYKTETLCQTNSDCAVCAPGKTQSCTQGTCIQGRCYWKHNTNQCQKGYIKVCEAGMCECLPETR